MLKGLHLLRGLASVFILIYHTYFIIKIYNPIDFHIISYFHIGVDIFFILSGFIIILICNKNIDKIGNGYWFYFLKDRFLRVVPLYWFFTFLMFIVGGFYPLESEQNKNIIDLIQSLLFISTGNPYDGFYPVLGVGWTLNYEMFFYILAFFSILFFNKRYDTYLFVFLIILITSGFLFDINHIDIPNYLYLPLSKNLLEFAIGMLIARIYLFGFKRNVIYVIPVSLLLALLFIYDFEFLTYSLISSFIFVIFLKVKNINIEQSFLRRFLILGNISYVLYLIHQPILSFVAKFYFLYFSKGSVLGFVFISYFLIFISSYIFTVYYERLLYLVNKILMTRTNNVNY
jgi:peptidoglycan/LPS O-acetylase OafA/YrhL